VAIVSEIAFAARTLRKRPGFTLSVISTLGIAIAAASTIAVVADQALLRPLPFRDPANVLVLFEKAKGGDIRLASYPTFLDWQRTSRAFAQLGYARGRVDYLSTPEGALRATAAFISPGYLAALGASPRIGRFFSRDEEAAGRGDAVVLSERFWRAQFGGDPSIVGKSVTLTGRSATVVGVMSTPMAYPLWADLWRPISAVIDIDPALASRYHHTDTRLVGRLRPGVTPAAAMNELASIERTLSITYGEHGPDWTGADFKPISWEYVGNSASALGVLTGAIALTLLIACVNIATLLLLRTFARERELAIRSALGAGRARIVHLTLAESGVLGAGATALALLLTWWGLVLIRTAAPETIPRTSELVFDARVAGLVIALAAVATIIAASVAAVRAFRTTNPEALRAGWQPTAGGRSGNRWRGGLASAQLALALTLITGAGLLLDSFRQLRNVDLGFDPTNLAAFWILPPTPKYGDPANDAALYTRLQEAAAAVPGVEGVAIVNHIPLNGGYAVTKMLTPGRAPASDGSDAALYKTVSENYLRVMHGRVLRGRWFTDADIRGSGNGIVVNERVAKRLWPDKDPIGQPMTVFRSSQARAGFGDPSPSIVLGVIGDMRQISVSDDPPEEVYVPYTREVWPGVALMIRTRGDSRALESAIRRALLEVEPNLPVLGAPSWHTFEPIGNNVSRLLAPRRTVMGLVLAFGAAALLLAAIGVYGVTAFGVAQRKREFGIRMAIGATSRDVIALVLRQGGRLAAIGAVAGTLGAFALAKAFRASLDSMLYRTSPFAVVPIVAAITTLLCVVVAASWVPARRASAVDPMAALRSE
jgi:putative ABC transport system permease protein